MIAVRRRTLVLWLVSGVLVLVIALVLGRLVLRRNPVALGVARAHRDIALGQPKYYFLSGVANAPPPASLEAYRARGVSLTSTGCQPLSDEETAYNEAIAEHYRR